tara:strand:- start:6 stop:626 length:621 start_codon:yes stop_codon:yes gene_type:complete
VKRLLLFSIFLVFLCCSSSEQSIGVTVVSPEPNQGLEGVIENTSLELYEDITYILDLDYNDQYEDQSCNYRYQVLLYIGIGGIVEQISYQYRVCADENLRECVQKQVYNLSFDFEKIDNGDDYGFRKLCRVNENSFSICNYLQQNEADEKIESLFVFESRGIIKSNTSDENNIIDENNPETYYFLENGTTTIDEVREYSCNDELYD